MQIRDLSTSGAMPTLELTMRFAGARQRLLAHNIANIDTPNFVATDVDPRSFQRMLGQAVDRRREKTAGAFGPLEWRETRELRAGDGGDGIGSLRLRPHAAHGGVLAHDRNASDPERLMQDMVENATVYRVATDLYRAQRGTMMAAISQRA